MNDKNSTLSIGREPLLGTQLPGMFTATTLIYKLSRINSIIFTSLLIIIIYMSC